MYKINVLIDGGRKYFSSLLNSIYKGLNSFYSSETQKKICQVVRKKPYLSPLLINGHLRLTSALKPKMGNFSLLYANIAPKWNAIISRERQIACYVGTTTSFHLWCKEKIRGNSISDEQPQSTSSIQGQKRVDEIRSVYLLL